MNDLLLRRLSLAVEPVTLSVAEAAEVFAAVDGAEREVAEAEAAATEANERAYAAERRIGKMDYRASLVDIALADAMGKLQELREVGADDS